MSDLLFDIPLKTRALATISIEIQEQARTMNACNYAMQVLGRTDLLWDEFARASKMVSVLITAKEMWEAK